MIKKIITTALLSVAMFATAFGQTGPAPSVRFLETDQTLPAGLWRIQLDGDTLTIDRNTAAGNNFSTATTAVSIDTSGNITLGSTAFLTFAGSGPTIFRDGAPNLLAIQRGLNPNQVNIYNTFTSGTSLESADIGWVTAANTFLVQTRKGSAGGSARPISIRTDEIEAINVSTSQVVSFGLPASAAADILVLDSADLVGDGQRDSHSILWTGKGFESATPHDIDWKAFVDVTSDDGTGSIWTLQSRVDAGAFADQLTVTAASTILGLPQDTASIRMGAALDAQMHRGEAADIIEQRRGANPQEWRLYDRFVSSSDYDRLTVYIGGGPPLKTIEFEAESTVAAQGMTIQIEAKPGSMNDGRVTLLNGGTSFSVAPTTASLGTTSNGLAITSGTTSSLSMNGFISSIGVGQTTPGIGIKFDIGGQGASAFADSHSFDMIGAGELSNRATWRTFVDVLDTSANSIWTLQDDFNGGGFVTNFSITDDGDFSFPAVQANHVIGAAAGNTGHQLILDGDWFATNPGSTILTSTKFQVENRLTGAQANTTGLFGVEFDVNIRTQTVTENIADVAQLNLEEPDIEDLLTGGGVIVQASTLRIGGAPTEGVVNFALLIEAGEVIFDSPERTTDGFTDSFGLTWVAQGHDGVPIQTDWRAFVEMVDAEGEASVWKLQTRIDSGAFANALQVKEGTGVTGETFAANGGGTPASGGAFRVNNTGNIAWRNAADSGNIFVLRVDNSDNTILNADFGDLLLLRVNDVTQVSIGLNQWELLTVGPHAIGGFNNVSFQMLQTGSYTAGAAGGSEAAIYKMQSTLTGASGKTVGLHLLDVDGAIITQTATEDISNVTTLNLEEPQITDNLTGNIIEASTLRVAAEPTEGVYNQALFVPAGKVRFGNMGTGGLDEEVTEKLTVLEGNIEIYNQGTQAAESLQDGDFSSFVNWDEVDDFSEGTGNYVYLHSAGSGLLGQTNANRAISTKANRMYEFTYTVSSVTAVGSLVAILSAEEPGAVAVTLDVSSAGTRSVIFQSDVVSNGPFNIEVTSDTASDGFTIDDVSLKEITGGDLILAGKITGGGSNGISVDGFGRVTLSEGLRVGVSTTPASQADLEFSQDGFGLSRSGSSRLFLTSNGSVPIAWTASSPAVQFMADTTSIKWSDVANALGSTVSAGMFRDGDDLTSGIIALRDNTTPHALRIYDTFTSSTNYHRMSFRTNSTTLSSVSGASVTTAVSLIPDGAIVLGVTTDVAVALGVTNGTTGYEVGDGVDADRWGSITGTATTTFSDDADFTTTTVDRFTGGPSEVTITAIGGNFDGTGDIVVVVDYIEVGAQK